MKLTIGYILIGLIVIHFLVNMIIISRRTFAQTKLRCKFSRQKRRHNKDRKLNKKFMQRNRLNTRRRLLERADFMGTLTVSQQREYEEIIRMA